MCLLFIASTYIATYTFSIYIYYMHTYTVSLSTQYHTMPCYCYSLLFVIIRRIRVISYFRSVFSVQRWGWGCGASQLQLALALAIVFRFWRCVHGLYISSFSVSAGVGCVCAPTNLLGSYYILCNHSHTTQTHNSETIAEKFAATFGFSSLCVCVRVPFVL